MKTRDCVLLLLSTVLLSCNKGKSDTKEKTANNIKENNCVVEKSHGFLVVKTTESNCKKVDVITVDSLFNVKDSIASYQAKYEISGDLSKKDFFRIDTINNCCYFFESKSDEALENFIHNYLIQFNYKTGKTYKLHDFKDSNIDEWEVDPYNNYLVYRDFELEKLFTFNLKTNEIKAIYKFNLSPWYLNVHIEKYKYVLTSKEKGNTIKREIEKKNNKCNSVTIWTTPSPLLNAKFAAHANKYAEIAPEKIRGNEAALYLYDKRNSLKQDLLMLYGNEEIYWIADYIVIKCNDRILVFNHKLNLIKMISVENLRKVLSIDNELIIFEQRKSPKKHFLLNKELKLIELKTKLFDNIQSIEAVPNM